MSNKKVYNSEEGFDLKVNTIIATAERMTSGNFEHGRSNILLNSRMLKEDLNAILIKQKEEIIQNIVQWINTNLPDIISLNSGSSIERNELIIQLTKTLKK